MYDTLNKAKLVFVYAVHLLVLIYSAYMSWLYLQSIFFQSNSVFHFYQMTLKSHGLLLTYLFCYLIGSSMFFLQDDRRISSIIIGSGSVGFIVGAVVDFITNYSFQPHFYLLYVGLHLVVLFVAGYSLIHSKRFLISLAVMIVILSSINLFILKGFFL